MEFPQSIGSARVRAERASNLDGSAHGTQIADIVIDALSVKFRYAPEAEGKVDISCLQLTRLFFETLLRPVVSRIGWII